MAFTANTIAFVNWLIFLNILLNRFQPTYLFEIQSLGGYWNAENAKRSYNFPAIVPGGIYSDLMSNNIIDDVFYKFNDVETRWVSKIDWNYTKWFTVEDELVSHNNINLVFEGIDTFATVLINDESVGATENMFVRYIFNIKPFLKPGKNSIMVQFKSPVNTARSIFEEQARKYIVPPRCVPEVYNGECHVNHIRKMQASFAWDWGPAFPSVGIWKPVYIEAFNSSVIRDVVVAIHSNATTGHWDITINTYLAQNNGNSSIEGTIIIKLHTEIETLTNIYRINANKDNNGQFLYTQNLSIPKSYVRLWWPNGYGDASLYPLKVSYISPNKHEKDIKRLKIGFRTIQLVQNGLKTGKTFYFKVNDVPIFAKGSNVIPINILPELGQNETVVRFLLQSAKDAHMNMLRVWGGGVYESNAFYQTADELGIMIWQDFMFACSMYPTNKTFLSSIRNEVRHQVRRLQYHPSIVLWAGNNENELALRGNWYGTQSNFSVYQKDYITLYVHTIKDEVLQNDNTRLFLTSSPSNGIESEEENYIAKNPGSKYYGDVHFYNYILDGFNTVTYPINRFASEFGYQSLPSMDTLLTATNDTKDLYINSPFLSHRQHLNGGYSAMKLLISYQLKLPNEKDENYNEIFVFYSQIIQAMSIKIETEYYRQWRSNINDASQGLTMGALYWQLNDVWVAPSWSSIDFKNNWKMLHYFAKKFFAPIIVTGNKQIDNGIDVFVVSDLLLPVHNSVLNITVYSWDSFTPVSRQSLNIEVLPQFSQLIKRFSTSEMRGNEDTCGKYLKNCFLYFTLYNSNNEVIAPDNFIFPTSLNQITLKTPSVKIANVKQTNATAKVFEIEIKTDKIALFVWLNIKNIRGLFSDNGFLQVTPTKVVYFSADEITTAVEIQKSLTVTHLLYHNRKPLGLGYADSLSVKCSLSLTDEVAYVISDASVVQTFLKFNSLILRKVWPRRCKKCFAKADLVLHVSPVHWNKAGGSGDKECLNYNASQPPKNKPFYFYEGLRSLMT